MATAELENNTDRAHIDDFDPADDACNVQTPEAAYRNVMLCDPSWLFGQIELLASFDHRVRAVLHGPSDSIATQHAKACGLLIELTGTLTGLHELVKEAKAAKRAAE
jgi:hypothetical protein